jgi:hypothetical protein
MAVAVAVLAPLPWVALADHGGLSPQRLLRFAMTVVPRFHLHWFRWCGEDPAGNGSLYKCRCGVVRPGF